MDKSTWNTGTAVKTKVTMGGLMCAVAGNPGKLFAITPLQVGISKALNQDNAAYRRKGMK